MLKRKTQSIKTTAARPTAQMNPPAVVQPAPRRELTSAQARLADSFADMILAESHEEDLWPVIVAAARHRHRPSYAKVGYASQEEMTAALQNGAEAEAKWIYQGILRDRRPAGSAIPKERRAEPQTVTERVQAMRLNGLRESFEECIEELGGEELALLHDILRARVAIGYTFHDEQHHHSMPIAESIMEIATGESETWVKVPHGADRYAIDIAVRAAMEARERKCA